MKWLRLHDLPGINLNEKTSASMIVRQLGERGSSSEESRLVSCEIFYFFDFFCRYSFDRDVGQFAAK